MLEVRDLCKSYVDGERHLNVLQGLNLNLDAGETIAVMGPSGCGKSTLISCLAGLVRSDSGSIHFEKQELTKLSTDLLTKKRTQDIGIVFQQFHLIPYLTALENIRLPLDFRGFQGVAAEEQSRQTLKLVGLQNRADHYPNQLSRGECQRVAIARVLVNTPKLILADEPTASLDRQTGKEIINLLVELCRRQNTSLIVVTHDQEMAAACEKKYDFVDGRLKGRS